MKPGAKIPRQRVQVQRDAPAAGGPHAESIADKAGLGMAPCQRALLERAASGKMSQRSEAAADTQAHVLWPSRNALGLMRLRQEVIGRATART